MVPNFFFMLRVDFLRNTQNLKKVFLIALTNQLIYLVNIKTMRKIFSNYVCFSKNLNFTDPTAQTAQKEKSHTTKSPLMQNWVFRLVDLLSYQILLYCVIAVVMFLAHPIDHINRAYISRFHKVETLYYQS